MKDIFGKQWLHALLLAALLAALAWASTCVGVAAGSLWGVPTLSWFWLAVALAVAHQVYVWFCWRTQLHVQLLTRAFGAAAFPLYATGFALLGLARVLAVFVLATANGTAVLGSYPVLRFLSILALMPAFYLLYCVARYFGATRARGIDHFDPSYRALPLVRKGVFRITRNAMYTFGFFILWVPALWCASPAALCIALFNHLYVWVHYYTTEYPDMLRIYPEGGAPEQSATG